MNRIQYSGCEITASLGNSNKGREDEEGKEELDFLLVVAPPPYPYLGWLPHSVFSCSGQQSSGIL